MIRQQGWFKALTDTLTVVPDVFHTFRNTGTSFPHWKRNCIAIK